MEDVSGINISKLKQIMSEEDKVDKKIHASKLKEKNWLVNRIDFMFIPFVQQFLNVFFKFWMIINFKYLLTFL